MHGVKPLLLLFAGSRGIGEAIALRAAADGYAVLLTYASREDAARSVVDRIIATGGEAWAVQADTGREADVLRAYAEADRLAPRRLVAMVYNSGITGPSSALVDASTETLAEVVNVNLLGALLSAREALRRMSTGRGGHGGSIVLISSRAAFYGSPGEHVWYAATKGGVDSLAAGLAREAGAQGVRVNAVSPGPIRTDIHVPGKLDRIEKGLPMQRAGEPDEVAAAVLFLLSQQASYVSGANLSVSGAR